MLLGRLDQVVRDTAKEGRGLEIRWRTWLKSSILRITCHRIWELVQIKVTCTIRDFIWLSRSLLNKSSSTQTTSRIWDMVNKAKEAPLQCKVRLPVTSPQQPNQEVLHSSTSLNPHRTLVLTQLAESTKTIDLLGAPASAEANPTSSPDHTAVPTKLLSTKAI
jgi:hypothetical protein